MQLLHPTLPFVALLACAAVSRGTSVPSVGVSSSFDCEKVWMVDEPVLPSKGDLSHYIGRAPPSFDDWHPDLANLEAFAYFNCLVSEALQTGAECDLNKLDKKTANASWEYEVAVATHGVTRRREFSAMAFVGGMTSALSGQGATDVVDALSGGIYSCVTGIKKVATDLYNFFMGRSLELVSVIKNLAGLITDCAEAASSWSPFGWLKRVMQVVKVAFHASDIVEACGSLISQLAAPKFDSYKTGQAAGKCVYAIADAMSRRRRAAVAAGAIVIPEAWSCDPAYYNASDGCDLDCGGFDPDCQDADMPYMYPELYNAYNSPHNWSCPATFFNATDGCDSGCGAVDPDCAAPVERRRSTDDVWIWPKPNSSFQVGAKKAMDVQLHSLSVEGHPEVATSKNPGATGSGISARDLGFIVGGLVGGLVLGIVIAVLVVRGKNVGRRQAEAEMADYQLLPAEGERVL